MTTVSGNSRRIGLAILKRPLNFCYFFSILWRSLSKFITQTDLYSTKQQLETTFHQFCEKSLHITFNTIRQRPPAVYTFTMWTAPVMAVAAVLS